MPHHCIFVYIQCIVIFHLHDVCINGGLCLLECCKNFHTQERQRWHLHDVCTYGGQYVPECCNISTLNAAIGKIYIVFVHMVDNVCQSVVDMFTLSAQVCDMIFVHMESNVCRSFVGISTFSAGVVDI